MAADTDGSIGMHHALEVKVVNVGVRTVEVSQVHVDLRGIGPYWLSDAHGLVNLRLEPGESQRWIERLEAHHRRHKERCEREGTQGPLIVRGVATTADDRVFVSRWQRMDHIDGLPSLWRLKWKNRWRRLRRFLSRKPPITN